MQVSHQSLQKQSADHEADKQQLIATITSLRRELEQQAEKHAIVLQRERAHAAEEIRQLQTALIQQRDLLEQKAMERS